MKTIFSIRHLFKWIFDSEISGKIGVVSNRVRAVNFFVLSWIPILLSLACFALNSHSSKYGIAMLTTLVMFILTLFFTHQAKLKFGILVYVLVLNFNLTLINVLFEFNYATFLFLFPLFASVSFLYPLPKNKNMLTLVFSLMFLLHLTSFYLISAFPSKHLVVYPNSFFTQMNYIFSFLLTFLIVIKYNVLQSQQRIALDGKIALNEQQKELLEETLKDKNILLSEIHHRTKNNLAIVSSMLNLQRHHVDNQQLKNILLDCSNRVHSMASVHQKLYEKGNFAQIDLKDYLQDLIRDLQNTIFPQNRNIQLLLEIDSFPLTSDKAIPCALILNELITNSVKHAFNEKDGKIEIRIKKIAQQILLMVQDNGPGFKYDSSLNNTSLGMTLIEALTEQLDGNFEFNTKNGTTFTLSFKLN